MGFISFFFFFKLMLQRKRGFLLPPASIQEINMLNAVIKYTKDKDVNVSIVTSPRTV